MVFSQEFKEKKSRILGGVIILFLSSMLSAAEISFEDFVEDGKVEHARQYLTNKSFAAISENGYFVVNFKAHKVLKTFVIRKSTSKVAFVEESGYWNLKKDPDSGEVLIQLKPGRNSSNKALRNSGFFFFRKLSENSDIAQLYSFCLSPDDDEDNCSEIQHYQLYEIKTGRLVSNPD